MTKTICHTVLLVTCDLLVTHHTSRRLRTHVWARTGTLATTRSGFRHNFSEKLSVGPKNGIERRVSRFSTIFCKTQVLNLVVIIVTVILQPVRATTIPETNFLNLITEARDSGLDLKFGCSIFYTGNPETMWLPLIPRNQRYLYKSATIKFFGHI